MLTVQVLVYVYTGDSGDSWTVSDSLLNTIQL